jgi:hypothetical protein
MGDFHAEPIRGGQEQVRIRLRVRYLIPRDYRHGGRDT